MWLQGRSSRVEIVLVNAITFGPFAAISIAGALKHERVLVFDNRRLYMIAAIEIVAGIAGALILRARRWSAADLGIGISMPSTIAGAALFVAANVTIAGSYALFRAITGTDPAAATTPVASVSWPALLLFLLVDPIFEETFEVAYNMRATAKDGVVFGVTLTTLLRVVRYGFQGPVVIFTILPLGIVFGLVYWKWRRVWPLVVAHGIGAYFGLTGHL
jgi:CAAX protease family protein